MCAWGRYFVCLVCLCALCTMCTQCQQTASDPLGILSQMLVSYHVGDAEQTQVLCKSNLLRSELGIASPETGVPDGCELLCVGT